MRNQILIILYFNIAVIHDIFRPDTARKLSENLYDIYHCCVCSKKLLMMDRETV